jgi:hypothetical protein
MQLDDKEPVTLLAYSYPESNTLQVIGATRQDYLVQGDVFIEQPLEQVVLDCVVDCKYPIIEDENGVTWW